MINEVLGTTPEQASNGTTVLNTLALQRGGTILRVHDVRPAREAVLMQRALWKAAGSELHLPPFAR
jgi:dihydropteroate synthase